MSSSSTALQREREVHSILESWRTAQGSSLNVALRVDSIADADLRGHGYTPKVSADKSLTAFAQLATLRLDVKRGMVSLIDDKTQTILAEATRNLLLGISNPSAPQHEAAGTQKSGDEDQEQNGLWRSTVLSRPDAMCEHSLENSCTGRDGDGRTYTTAGLIVPDARQDQRFQHRSYVTSSPGVRFYAGVPIMSRKGHKIGVYAVSDDRPREGLTVDELRFMEGVAQAVMEHLEWARDRVDRFKGERIARGLAAFVEGCSSPDSGNDSVSRPPPTNREIDLPIHSSRNPLYRGFSYTEKDASERPTPRDAQVSAGNHVTPPAARDSSPTTSTPSTPRKAKNDGLSSMFYQAADILRRSTIADGVAIFGATTDGGNTSKHRRRNSNATTSSGEGSSRPETPRSETAGSHASSESDTPHQAAPCKLLAMSLADDHSRATISPLPIGTLEQYFLSYPRGKAFSFTDGGTGFSSSSEEDGVSDTTPEDPTDRQPAKNGRRKGKVDHRQLLKRMPGARSVVFVPLFDYIEDRLAGGMFLWASSTGTLMNLDEGLSHLRAFGTSIMNQVWRINTQRNEAAKTTFIASMSHELRSPLHGILGAVEFLKDTAADAYQASLINSVSTCGKTLLDTLNHVLDYSKINRLGRTRTRKDRGRQASSISHTTTADSFESMNMTTAVDLSMLVEEVVDAVSAGHTFRNSTAAVPADATEPQQPRGAAFRSKQVAGSQGPVSVLLDITPLASWGVKTQPGAVRRIVMNLFGNALKYTPSGYILVSLRGRLNEDKSKINVTLKVEDTGIGMSENFQQSRLFVPFSQEDTFQPGTGLGLSIVRQIVDSLDGTLEVKSAKRQGTTISVRLSLPVSTDSSATPPDEALDAITDTVKGLCLVIVEGDTSRGPDRQDVTMQVTRLNEVIAQTCSSWFEMKVITESDPSSVEADAYLYCEPPSVEALEQRFGKGSGKGPSSKRIPIIIVCLNTEEAAMISKNQTAALAHLSHIVEVIPQPCGPRKMAKIFAQCLGKAEDMGSRSHDVRGAQRDQGSGPWSENQESKTHSKTMNRLDTSMGQGPSKKVGTSQTPSISSTEQSPHSSVTSPAPLNAGRPSVNAGEDQQRSTSPFIGSSSQRKHVLLVDDNKINLQLLVMFVKKCGFSYEEAENGQEAVDRFAAAAELETESESTKKKRDFDFILMDINMPIMNGLEATRHIREIERTHGLRPTTIIALTGLGHAEAKGDALTAGINVFLPKPVRFADLQKMLTQSKTEET